MEISSSFHNRQRIECSIAVLLSDRFGLAIVVHKGKSGDVSGAFEELPER